MTPEYVLNDLAEQQGWSLATQLDLCLTYIDHQGDNEGFKDFLNTMVYQDEQANEELDEIIELLKPMGNL